eukprot:COSAG05_NODE_2665_length_2784_cov_18.161266_2_plen_78_part_00
MFKFQAVLAQIQPFLSRSVEKRGDQSRFKSVGLYVNIPRSRYAFSDLFSPGVLPLVLPLDPTKVDISAAGGKRGGFR